METDEIWTHVDAGRAALADLLDTLDTEQWQEPSLCEGWTVRDVGAHLTMAHARLHEVLGPVLRQGFRMPAMIRVTAVDNPVTTQQIPQRLRAMLGSRRRAPFVSPTEPLIDVLVHTQDICVPLGLDVPMPPAAAVAATERMITLNRNPFVRLRPPLTGVRLVATDVEWARGEGPEVRGPVRAITLLVAGRESAALPHLSGALDRVGRPGPVQRRST